MPSSLDKLFNDLVLSSEQAVFIDEIWANRRSLKYTSLLRQSATTRNYFELQTKELTEEGIVSALAKSKVLIDDQSAYRLTSGFLEKKGSGVLVFHQSHLISANVLHLVSRIIRFTMRQNLDWKFIFFGDAKGIDPLKLDQLFIQKYYPTKAKRKPARTNETTKAVAPNKKKALSLFLPLLCLAIAALLLFDNDNPTEQLNSYNPDTQFESTTITSPSLGLDSEKENIARNAALLEAIRQSRLRDLEFEEILAKIDSQADEQQVFANATETSVTQKASASASPERQITQNNSAQLPAQAETAIRRNDLDAVKNLLNSNDLRVSSNQVGETPLVVAINTGNRDVVNWLLQQNVPVNLADQYGRTAIFYAAISGDDALIESIINAGGQVNVSSKLSKTPLMAAVNNNHFSATQLLIEKGANVTNVDHSGWPAIFYAAWNTNLEMVNLLINSGAEIGVRDNSGVSLKEIAEAKGATHIIDLLN